MASAVESTLAAAVSAVADLVDELADPADALIDAVQNPDALHLRESAKRAQKALGSRSANSPLVAKAQRLDDARDAA